MSPRLFARADELPAAVGERWGPGPWLRVSQAMVDRFAELTGDRQWIHVDPARAASGPFGVAVAHGYLLVGLLTPMLAEIVRIGGVGHAVNQGVDRLRFRAPVAAGSAVRAQAVLASAHAVPGGYLATTVDVTVEAEAQERPALTAQCHSLYRLADGVGYPVTGCCER
ncbi:MAG: MaoC family dehydratase [Thermocrispum sp.]